jgi:ectoine hydroxylase-related dioxygenase (phytanoyl-CoA dioxygenase family)
VEKGSILVEYMIPYDLMNCERIYSTIKRFFPEEIVPFQSISSHYGSEQNVHSDAIHMTTRPLGGLVAAWVAFDKVSDDSGPVEYYPKSHRLPYVLSQDVGINPNKFERKGYAEYANKYEPFIYNKINKLSLKSKKFLAQKGDVLFWHHNLLHGGAEIVNKSSTRKSFVFHYFRKDVCCYHDLSGRDADLSFLSN